MSVAHTIILLSHMISSLHSNYLRRKRKSTHNKHMLNADEKNGKLSQEVSFRFVTYYEAIDGVIYFNWQNNNTNNCLLLSRIG